MKDKVQKILNEITTRKLCTMDEHMAFYNDKAKEDYRFLSEIEELIKALQEEPSKFDAAIQEGDDVRYNEDLGCRINLSQLKRVAKKEEPVSEELEEAAIEICSKVLKGETITIDGYEYVVLSDAEECFKAGAKWQLNQIRKENEKNRD